MTERVEIRVVGRVQGVGFRAFTQAAARRLGLAGWVRNERDGSVRVVAEGPRERLERLIYELKTGPRMSRVEHVHADYAAAEGIAAFEVRY